MNHKEQIAHLEKLTIAKEANFQVAVYYFLDISEDVSLMKHSTLLELEERHTFFRALLQPVTKQYGETVTVEKCYLMCVKDMHFVHGFARLSNSVTVGFYFFDTIKTGMAFIASSTGKGDFFRLTAFETTQVFSSAFAHTIIPSKIDNTYH